MSKQITVDLDLYDWVLQMAYERVELFHAAYKGFRPDEHSKMDLKLQEALDARKEATRP
jgi:hypothetical protein